MDSRKHRKPISAKRAISSCSGDTGQWPRGWGNSACRRIPAFPAGPAPPESGQRQTGSHPRWQGPCRPPAMRLRTGWQRWHRPTENLSGNCPYVKPPCFLSFRHRTGRSLTLSSIKYRTIRSVSMPAFYKKPLHCCESTTFIVKSPNFTFIFRTFFTRKMQKQLNFPFILFLSNCPQTWYNNQVRYTAAFSALENGVFDYD